MTESQLKALLIQFETLNDQQVRILERLDEIEEKIDNLNLSANAGYESVDDL